MSERLSECILFRGLFAAAEDGALPGQLVAFAEDCGLGGDLWRGFLAAALLRHENPWSLACEGRAEPESTLSVLAERDMARILPLYRGDALRALPELRDYRPAAAK
ncbi:MAG: hypothetical protein K6G54_04600, partial [Oscillospiraceae bacterium]|nr:hypothetical protein [Oscillospiraceae bacterium]